MTTTQRAAPPARNAAQKSNHADNGTLARNDNFVNPYVALHGLALAFRPESVALVVVAAGGGL
jgi:hypothetical protein